MRTFKPSIVILTALLTCPVMFANSRAAAQQLKDPDLEGSWYQVAEIADGKIMGINVEGDRLTMNVYFTPQMMPGSYVYQITNCNIDAEPRQLDLKLVETPEGSQSPQLGQTTLAVYQIEDGRLSFAMGKPGYNDHRPQDFEERLLSKRYFAQWYSPDNAPPPTKHALNDDGVDEALVGHWATVKTDLRTIYYPDHTTVYVTDDDDATEDVELASWDITDWKTDTDPRQLYLEPTLHPNAALEDVPLPAIYKVEDDTFTFVAPHPFTSDDPTTRPTDFTPKQGIIISVMRRD